VEANNFITSLPSDPHASVRDGSELYGNDLDHEQLQLWYLQEAEAFFELDSGNSQTDPWYDYMRYTNDKLGFSYIDNIISQPTSMLVLGPGSGIEVLEFSQKHLSCRISFLESSVEFQRQLKDRFPGSDIITPVYSGDINLPARSQDLVCAFSVLHHIPNVSKVFAEVSRVMRPGGLFLVREPCSSMGIWGRPRSATPNERGISCSLMVKFAEENGFVCEIIPTPIILEPINKFLKKTVGFKSVPFPLLYQVDRILSRVLSFNDFYWRDSLLKKLGPSSYFYVFCRV